MGNLQKSVRQKRYQVKNNCEVFLWVGTQFGDTIKFQITNCSQNGLKATWNETGSDTEWLREGDIVSSSKLVFDSKEVSLGRLAIRRAAREEDGSWDLAFSCVDIPVPVTGHLSKFLDINLDRENVSGKELSSGKFTLAHFVENEHSNADLFSRIREFGVFHSDWLLSDKYAYQNIRVASKGNRVELNRLRKGGRKDYLMMGSNDYLGLGAHPEVVEATKKALDIYGFGSTGSPVSTGMSDLHTELQDKVARLHQKEAALLYNSGYAANVGIIGGITTTGDLVIADQLCHASIQDAMNMSKATSRFFKHNNIEHLKSILEKERGNFNGCLIVTEGVFSMDGDTAPLDQIFALARQYNARVMVDQAHCFGVVGPNGLGICDKFNLLRDVDIIMGTFSKIGGGIGGFVAGSKDLIDWLRYFSRSHLFSVSLPPSTVAAVLKSLDIFTSDKSLVSNLKRNVKQFVTGLKTMGFEHISENHESAVIPVLIGDETKMGTMYQSLLEDGIWCTPVVYPVVSRRNCRFRFTMMATHTVSDVDYALACLEKAMLKAGFVPPKLAETEVKKAA